MSLIAVVVGGTFAPGRAVTPRRLGRATQTISEKCDSQSNIGKVYCGSDTAPYCDATQLFVCSGVGRGLTVCVFIWLNHVHVNILKHSLVAPELCLIALKRHLVKLIAPVSKVRAANPLNLILNALEKEFFRTL